MSSGAYSQNQFGGSSSSGSGHKGPAPHEKTESGSPFSLSSDVQVPSVLRRSATESAPTQSFEQ